MLQVAHSTLAVGWLFVAFAVPATLLSLVFGPLVDRFDRRTLCMISDAASAVVAIGLPVWLLSGGEPMIGIYVVTALLAAIGALFMPASNALIKERVIDSRLGPFSANFEIATQAGTLLSTAIGGVLVQLYGASPLFFFNGATYVASMGFFLVMGRRIGRTDVLGEPLPVTAAPVRAPLARLGLLYALGQPIVVVVNTLIVVLLLQTFGQKAGVLGIADSLAGVGIIAAAALYKTVAARIPNLRIVLVGYVLCALVLALEPRFGVVPFIIMYPFGALLFGISRVAARTMLLHAVPESMAGRVFGVTNSVGLAFSVAATVLIARLVDRTTIQNGYLALALMVACTTAVAVGLLWKQYGRPIPDPTLDPVAPLPDAH